MSELKHVTTNELCDLSLQSVARLIRDREVSPVEVTEAVLERIKCLDGKLNAFITVLGERALEQARIAETEILAGRYRGPLHGVPISVKDIFDTAGIRTTAGSRILADHVPTRNAAVIDRLEQSGAVLIGKTNLLEFAYGTVHPDYGPSLNPWHTGHSAGGSSSGSAVAVAAGMGYGSVATDTGGSIRIPASFCGVFGLKPTFDRIDRAGLIPLSSSTDHIGPITRTSRDAGLLFAAIADDGAARAFEDDATASDPSLLGLRLGIDRRYSYEGADAEVIDRFEEAIRVCSARGAEVVEIELPASADSLDALLTIRVPEATRAHATWLEERACDYTPAVRARLEAGLTISAVDYITALETRKRLTAELNETFQLVDAMVMPAVNIPAPAREDDPTLGPVNPARTAGLIRLTGPFNLTGHPALTVPCGFTRGGLPVGLQLVGPLDGEAQILRIGNTYEQATS